MLVLGRTLDESIVIGDDVVVTVVEIRGDFVKLGITAPRRVPVHRSEIYLKVCHDLGSPTPALQFLENYR